MFIIGTERSGSNLLRLVLNSHSAFAVPHPPHLMRYFSPIAASYGDLRDEQNRRALARDAVRLVGVHINPWEHPVDVDHFVATAAPTLFGIVAAIYDEYRVAEGKRRWACKSTFMIDHVDDVLTECPKAQFVWLVRDPRDVAASAKHSVFGPFHPAKTAALWVRQQQDGFRALQRWGPRVVHLLRYEDLVTDPVGRLRELCQFLDERLEPAMLEHHRTVAARRTAVLLESWKGTDTPINATSVERHRSDLSDEERAHVVAVALPLMEALGYSTESAGRATTPPTAAAIAVTDLLLRLRTETRSLRRDRNHWRRWRRDATVIWFRVKALGSRAGLRAVRRQAGARPPRRALSHGGQRHPS